MPTWCRENRTRTEYFEIKPSGHDAADSAEIAIIASSSFIRAD